jgi:aspartate aminotransferase/aminotransferase
MPNPYQFADRMAHLDASGIRKVFDLAAKMTDPINLSIGQPDFDVPEPAKDAAIEAIREGHNKYTQTQGLAGLREAIGRQCCQEFNLSQPPPVLVTSGVSGGLVLAMQVLVNPGDEVVFADPYFVMYAHLTHLCGGVPVPVDTYPEFTPSPEAFERAITDRTRLIILNSPGNPTGRVYRRDELQAIAEIARKHDLLIVSDEIYDLFCYDEPFVSMRSLYENTLLLRGFSKTYAMTGWRIGWCTGPAPVIDKMTTLQQYSFVCSPSMAQHGALAALGGDVSEQVGRYRAKRDRVYDALGDSFGLVKPGGAFYAFIPAPGGDATSFVTRAIDHNVLIIPGGVFSGRDTHFRISYATDNEKLAKGLDILKSLA